MAVKKLNTELLESIRVDREERGMTLGAIMERYALSRGTAYRAIAGLDDSKVQRASPSRRVAPSLERPPRPPLSKADLGEAARQVIAGRMMLAGLTVFQPLSEDTPVDLLVLRPDGIALKCQCKTMFVQSHGIHTMPLVAVRKWGPGARVTTHRYTRDEVDFFLGYVVETGDVYVFPFDVTERFKTRLNIWILRQPAGRNGKDPFDASSYKNAIHLLH
jgi:hypothetical protein